MVLKWLAFQFSIYNNFQSKIKFDQQLNSKVFFHSENVWTVNVLQLKFTLGEPELAWPYAAFEASSQTGGQVPQCSVSAQGTNMAHTLKHPVMLMSCEYLKDN